VAAQSPFEQPPKDEAAFGELVSTEVKDDRATGRAEDGSRLVSPSFPIARKVAVLGLLFGALLLIPYGPGLLERFRVLTPGVSLFPRGADESVANVPAPVETVGEAALPGPTDDQQSRAAELDAMPNQSKGPIAKAAQELPIPPSLKEGKPPIPIDDPTGKALEKFYEKLLAVEQKQPGQIARIVYYGDSIVASDFITGKLRRLYQSRFGDAGHGYALVANAFPGWFHIDVSRKSSDQWKTSRCIGPFAEDGLYGLGCVSFVARRPDEWFSMGTADRDEWGRSVSRFELEYLEQPGGGDVDFILDDQKHSSLSTEGPEKKVKYHTVSVTDGAHRLEVRTTTDKETRLFGMRMERDVPGVTLSALGITGARARFLDKQDDAHWAAVLAGAKPDLVVLAFGTNEVGDGRMAFDENGQLSKDPMGDYERNLDKVMEQVEKACPNASYMLVGPPDMASNDASQGNAKPMVGIYANHQMNVAKKRGWAFWHQQKAMGGPGSMWSWVQAGMGNSDMIHPTGSGGNALGQMQYLAVMEGYENFKASKR
jgi:lysophospholipase L1-like esterase